MAYWLFKTEADAFSWDEQKAKLELIARVARRARPCARARVRTNASSLAIVVENGVLRGRCFVSGCCRAP